MYIKQLKNKNKYIKRNIYIHAEILPPLLLWVLTIAFCSRLSARSNILLSLLCFCVFLAFDFCPTQ